MLAKRTGMKVNIASRMPTLLSLASALGMRRSEVTALAAKLPDPTTANVGGNPRECDHNNALNSRA